jgi:monofunctional biosynthetic peptidoglycan transglycosylase
MNRFYEKVKPALSHLFKGRPIRWIVIGLGCVVVFEYFSLPSISIEKLRTENVGATALMAQRTEEAEDNGKPFKIVQKWVTLSRISRNLINAVIVAEDGTFFSHGGFDWYEMQESLERNLAEGRPVRGASTITQQLAKNLFLSTSKSPVRKLKEAVVTLRLEENLSKMRILELYLNIIEWGNGIFGVEAAAQKYFRVPASSLTREQAVRLAAVIPSPLRHTPNTDSRYVLRRSAIVLRRMEARGW